MFSVVLNSFFRMNGISYLRTCVLEFANGRKGPLLLDIMLYDAPQNVLTYCAKSKAI